MDSQGLPRAVEVTRADATDRDGALLMMLEQPAQMEGIRAVLVDQGYAGPDFAKAVMGAIGAATIVSPRLGSGFVAEPKRWVVERCFGWLEKCRRLWKNCERKLEASRAMVQLAFVAVMIRRL